MCVSFLKNSKIQKSLTGVVFKRKFFKNFFQKIIPGVCPKLTILVINRTATGVKFTINRKTKGENTMKYAYIRVSTVEQNEARQIAAMQQYEIPEENYFIEKVSGKNTDRPELQRLLSIIQEGDTIHIHDFSRLSRSTADLLNIVTELNDKGVHLVSNKENLDTSTPTGKLLLTMIGAINEFERTNMLERQLEGIKIAKEQGKYRKKDIDMDLFRELKKDVDSGLLTVTTACEELHIHRRSWYNLLKKINDAVCV